MKYIIILLSGIMTLLVAKTALYSQDGSTLATLSLQKYYKISDALVKSNAGDAGAAAKELVDLLKAPHGLKSGSDHNKSYLEGKASQYLNTIAGTSDLVKQRVAYQGLSDLFISQIKKEKQAKPAYILYCPMKKAYWISAVEEVKNPYYGSAMLNCGSVSETVK